ncbi:MAG: hypothetical protein HKN21_08065, partial [Candidatus Eisenbacteria bacterium]|nr:hypothetical protein [Candidatus Eisenbacteria bacterium]
MLQKFILKLSPMAVALLFVLSGSASGREVSALIPAGDPIYRELQLADLLGLLSEPLRGEQPISRERAFHLMMPFGEGLGVDTGLLPIEADPSSGLTRPVAKRLERARSWINPYDVFWGRGEYPCTFAFNPRKIVRFEGSQIKRGLDAPHYLDYGENRSEGLALVRDGEFFVEAEGFALRGDWRMRFDRHALTYRPLSLHVSTQFRNFRATLGRLPLAWGPERHGGLVISTNARPLDQLLLQSDRPFTLFGAESLGDFTAKMFLGKLDDPYRNDAVSPWLVGARFTYAPRKWLVLGASRTSMLGGEGNDFIITPGSVIDLILAKNENRVGGDQTNNTDHKATVDWSLYLYPLLRSLPLLDGGRLYGQYGGEDSPQEGPLPSATGHTYGIELVAKGVLLRAEASNVRDDRNLWYWHNIYTDGYTYRGRVMGHPMGQDSRAEGYLVSAPLGEWGLVTASMERQEHGFYAELNTPPSGSTSPIPYGVQDTFTLRVEKFMDGQLGTLGIEG